MAVGEIIEEADEHVHNAIGSLTGGAAGLLSIGAHEAKLLIQAARDEFADEMDKSFDRLSRERQIILANFVQESNRLTREVPRRVQRMADLTVLDVSSTLNRVFPGGSEYIRVINGMAQAQKESGYYEVSMLGTAFGLDKNYDVRVAGRRLSQGPRYIRSERQHELIIRVPSDSLNRYFGENLTPVPIAIDVIGESKPPWWKFWGESRPDTLLQYTGSLVLLPTYPVRYRLLERYEETEPDRSKVEHAEGKTFFAQPGHSSEGSRDCGHKGNVCADVCAKIPLGGQYTGTWSHQESFQGHGLWITKPRLVSGNRVCGVYRHHKHDRDRTVALTAHYHPPKDELRESEAFLVPVDTAATDAEVEAAKNGWLRMGKFYTARLSNRATDYELHYVLYDGTEHVLGPDEIPENADLVPSEGTPTSIGPFTVAIYDR